MDPRHKIIKDNFIKTCKNHNMIEAPSAPMLTDDKTVYFASATITPLKETLAKGNIPRDNLYIHQPCFRLKYIDEPFYDGEKVRYPGYFNMLGTLVHPKNIVDFQESIVKIIDDQDIPSDKVKVAVSSKDKILIKKLSEHYEIEYDTRAEKSYSWTYGMGDNITGRGLTFMLQQNDGNYKRIGQYIAISDNGKLIAAEYGVGIEVLLARKEQYKNEYDAFSIAPILQANNFKADFPNTHIFSSVASAYSTGISMNNYPRKGHKKALSRMLTNLLLLKMKDNLTDTQIVSVLKEFLNIEFGDDTSLNYLMHDFKIREDELMVQIDRVNSFVRNQKSLGKADSFINQKVSEMYPLYVVYDNMFKKSL